MKNTDAFGLGDADFELGIYTANTPPMAEYQALKEVRPVWPGEIDSINQACGNGWRKLFNVYAKLLYALDEQYFGYKLHQPSWQAYRDGNLLQAGSGTALLFSPPATNKTAAMHIVMGRTYASSLTQAADFQWLDREFAIYPEQKLIVCPYFDYRQLSNIKIQRLAQLMVGLQDSVLFRRR